MAIQYSASTIVNTTFTGGTKTNIVNAINTHLKTAGWTAVSGDGTGDVVLESATTPTAGNKIRVRLRDSAETNCAAATMQNSTGLLTSSNYFLLPGGGKTFRIICNKYQFFCFTPGASAAREYIAMGVPYIPAFLHTVVTGDLGWIQGNALSDNDTTVRPSFRTILDCLGSAGTTDARHGGLVNGNMWNTPGGAMNGGNGGQRLIVPVGALTDNNNGYRWHDDSLQLADPLIAWGLTTWTDEAKIRGQIWDAYIATDAFAADTALASVDSHSWHAITNSNAGSGITAKGTLFVATG